MRNPILDPATIHRITLDNGLRVIVRVDRSAPVAAVVTYLRVGYFDEGDALAGISHVLEHMFFKGTPRYGPGQIAQATKAAGGYLNAATIYDHTRYYTVLPASELAQGLAIQSDALLNSVIDEDELRRELQVIIQEARRKLDNPAAVAAESLYELMFRQHRMRRWRIGTEAFLNSLTRDQLFDFYRNFYRAERALVVVAGDVDVEQTHRLVEQQYGSLVAGGPPFDRGPAEPSRAGLRLQEKSGDIVQSRLELGWRTPAALHEDTAALDMLGIILGQGRASRLYRAVREAGWVHSIVARNYTPTELGVFQISAELHPQDTLPALTGIAGVVAGAVARIDDSDVERAQSLIESRVTRQLESMEGQANYLADWEALGNWQLGLQYLERMARLTPGELQAAAARYLEPDQAAVFIYRPHQAAPLDLTAEQLTARLQHAAPLTPAPSAFTAAPALHSAQARLERVEDDVSFFRTLEGIPIIVKARRATPLVSVALALRGGASLETAQQAGFSALVARTSIKGTARRTAAQLATAAEALGTSIQPGVSADLIDWSCTVPSRHFPAALSLLMEAALTPSFPEAEARRETEIALADLQQVRDDMYRYPLRLFLSAAFPGHPYGLTLEQTEATLGALTVSDLRTWHRKTVLEQQPGVFIVGDIDPQLAANQVASALAAAGSNRTAASSVHWPAQPARVQVERQKAQTALVLGFPGVAYGHEDATVLQVLANTIAGLGGRLFEELRSRRALAYTVAAYPIARAMGGAFVGYIATAPEREEEARAGLLSELGHLREDLLPREDVERARRFTIGTWHIRSQTNAAQLHDLMLAVLVGRGLAELREYEMRVQSVSPGQLRAAAQRYFDEARVVEAVVRGTGGSR